MGTYQLLLAAAVMLGHLAFYPNALMAVCLPGVVLLGRRNPWDGASGDLSYPTYLIHPLASIITLPGKIAEPIAIAAIVVPAWVMARFVERPIERFRQKRVKRRPSLVISSLPGSVDVEPALAAQSAPGSARSVEGI